MKFEAIILVGETLMLRAMPSLLAVIAVFSCGAAFSVAESPRYSSPHPSALQSSPKMPPYQALRRPAVSPNNPAISQPVVVKAQPYPYGYFGTSASRGLWSSHFGVNNTYTQWTRR